MKRLTSVAVGVSGALMSVGLWPAAATATSTVVIGPSQSVQAAVDHAAPGTQIVLKPGRYHQSVIIQKDGITLRGASPSLGGTVFEPPGTGLCSTDGGAAICVLGHDFNFQTGSAGTKPVRNVTVSGILFRNWPSFGVLGQGADNLRIENNVGVDNGDYGFVQFESTNDVFVDNKASGSEEAGIYLGDSPHANARVSGNDVSGNQFGVFIRHARHVQVTNNTANDNCQGILILDDGEPGGAGNVDAERNVIRHNNKLCPPTDDTPFPLQGGGILLVGATDSRIVANSIVNNRGDAINSGGIVLFTAKPDGSNPRNNLIRNNTAFGDKPADIRWDGSGTGNSFVNNHCGTSQPAWICG